MKKIYKLKQKILTHELRSNFSNIEIIGESTGMHLIVQWKDRIFTRKQLDEIRNEGLNIHCVSEYSVFKDQHLNQLIFGYGNIPEKKIVEGIKLLKDIINYRQ